jgi:hypothetical protein
LAHKRPASRAGKGLLTEAGLKSPIFYSKDIAIDGAAILEKLSAMQMEGIVSKNVEVAVPVGAERILVEDQLRAGGQVSDCRLCEGPAASRRCISPSWRGRTSSMSAKSAPASIENHQWKSARSLMRS